MAFAGARREASADRLPDGAIRAAPFRVQRADRFVALSTEDGRIVRPRWYPHHADQTILPIWNRFVLTGAARSVGSTRLKRAASKKAANNNKAQGNTG